MEPKREYVLYQTVFCIQILQAAVGLQWGKWRWAEAMCTRVCLPPARERMRMSVCERVPLRKSSEHLLAKI